jgi:hypothetical protein
MGLPDNEERFVCATAAKQFTRRSGSVPDTTSGISPHGFINRPGYGDVL